MTEAFKASDSDSDFRQRAICRDEDPELFFPKGNSGPALLQIEEAKAVCRRCPVMSACATWAIEHAEKNGVWGGMSEDERSKLIAKRQRASKKLGSASTGG